VAKITKEGDGHRKEEKRTRKGREPRQMTMDRQMERKEEAGPEDQDTA
jgi:hypothetical protein